MRQPYVPTMAGKPAATNVSDTTSGHPVPSVANPGGNTTVPAMVQARPAQTKSTLAGKETNYLKLIKAKEAAHAAEIKALKEQHAAEVAVLAEKVQQLEARIQEAEGAEPRERSGSAFSFIESGPEPSAAEEGLPAEGEAETPAVAPASEEGVASDEAIETFRQFVVRVGFLVVSAACSLVLELQGDEVSMEILSFFLNGAGGDVERAVNHYYASDGKMPSSPRYHSSFVVQLFNLPPTPVAVTQQQLRQQPQQIRI
jgi:hypothetical protein